MIIFNPRFLFLAVFAAAVTIASSSSSSSDECVYTIYVRTGSVIKAGTDSRIGLVLGDSSGRHVSIPDLESWGGLMGRDHGDYFERGSLDAFSGRGPCGLKAPICSLNLTSDGAGAHHGWFCDHVEVTATGPHTPCTQSLFWVRQWLATDAPPYQLYAYVDGCDKADRAEAAHGPRKGRFVVGSGGSSSSV